MLWGDDVDDVDKLHCDREMLWMLWSEKGNMVTQTTTYVIFDRIIAKSNKL